MKNLNQTVLGFVITLVLATAAQAGDVFISTGSLGADRNSPTATLLPNGKVLVAGGAQQSPDFAEQSLASVELYDPATGTWSWSPTRNLATAREGHTATLLPNGKVLVVGGYDDYVFFPYVLASAELYDPATGTWSPSGNLGTARYSHTATLLPSGKVLVAGGAVAGISLSSAELYDPATGTWTNTGSLGTVRAGHTATLLPNGKVLVTAGDDLTKKSAELYDPATGNWSPTSSLAQPRSGHTATLLPNGKVLIVGFGTNGSTELYNPATGTWSPSGSLGTARHSHTATLLSNGKVLVAGGSNPLPSGSNPLFTLTSAELYDPATGTWSPTGSLGTARAAHTATLLVNGQVLVAAGSFFDDSSDWGTLASAELYGPAPTFLNPILNLIRLGDGSIQFGFSNPSGPGYRVQASTDFPGPLNTWSNLGPATETPPGSGQFQFTDHQATSYPHRFYRVTSP